MVALRYCDGVRAWRTDNGERNGSAETLHHEGAKPLQAIGRGSQGSAPFDFAPLPRGSTISAVKATIGSPPGWMKPVMAKAHNHIAINKCKAQWHW
jgi:hypothetical protein